MTSVSGTVYDSAGAPVAGRIVRAYRRDTGALLKEGVSNDGVFVAADPSYASVSLLVRGEGANAGVVFTDAGPGELALTAAGTVVTSTAQVLYGASSLSFPSNTAVLSAAAGAPWQFGTGDFTLEADIYVTAAVTGGGDFWFLSANDNSGGAGNWALGLSSTGALKAVIGGSATLLAGSALATNAWKHVVWNRTGGTIKLFIEGVQADTNTTTANFTTTAPLRIGKGLASGFAACYMRSVRVTKGVGRYPAAFTALTTDRLGAGNTLSVGQYVMTLGGYAGEIQVVCLDDSAGTFENDLIIRTTGV